MKVLVVGSTGETGRELVRLLLMNGHQVKALLRPGTRLPDTWQGLENLTTVRDPISGMKVEQVAEHLKDCGAVVSCLGHNRDLKGLYGEPRRLVTDAVRLTCAAIDQCLPEVPVKFILMIGAGYQNPDRNEKLTLREKWMMSLIRTLIPPHNDNIEAAEYLRLAIGQNHNRIRWVVVRPDNLINESEVSPYTVHESPTRSAIFSPGATSRVNVAHFMLQLLSEETVWSRWEGEMPVIYNS